MFEVLLNTILMLAQLELDGRAAAVVLGLESRDFTHTLQVMQVPCSHLLGFLGFSGAWTNYVCHWVTGSLTSMSRFVLWLGCMCG